MEKISWTDRVRNEEASQRVKEESDIVHTIKRRNTNWIGHIMLKHRKGRRIEVTRRGGRRRKQVLDDINTLRTGLLNCLNACSRGLNFRHRASCI